MGRLDGASDRDGTADDVLWMASLRAVGQCGTPECRAERLLAYLEVFPLGRHNRAVAEAVETCIDELHDGPARRALHARLRALRDPLFPPVAPMGPRGHAAFLPPS